MIIKEKETDYSEWWNRVITDGELVDIRYNLKGFFVWMPYGFSLMGNITDYWDGLFCKEGIKKMYFPLLVPKEYAEKNKSWWNSFKEQAFYASGFFDNEKNVFLRPTGEPAMYPMFSLWIRGYKDLPLRIYENVSSFRNETKSTKVLVRDVEIGPWYEIHTAHATKEESEKEIELAIKLNEMIFNLIAVHPLKVRKPISDCFPGSIGAIEFYTLMNDSLVENGSCNNLGQAYAKAFDIQFTNEKQKKEYAWQTCTGNGERLLSAIIANHADEKGLIIPPDIAPTKACIVFIKLKEKEIKEKIDTGLKSTQLEKVEVSDITSLGTARYLSEKKGIPLRIEIGPKELSKNEVLFSWRTGKKEFVPLNKLKDYLKRGMKDMQEQLLESTKKEMNHRMKECNTFDEAKKSKIALIGWCGDEKCAGEIKYKTKKEIIGMSLDKKAKNCINCGKNGEVTYISTSY